MNRLRFSECGDVVGSQAAFDKNVGEWNKEIFVESPQLGGGKREFVVTETHSAIGTVPNQSPKADGAHLNINAESFLAIAPRFTFPYMQ